MVAAPAAAPGPRTLCIDIGGTGVKMLVLDARGKAVTERARLLTPHPATPRNVLRTVTRMLGAQGKFDRVSVGFPGVVVDGVTKNAPNLENDAWRGYDLGAALRKATGRPVRVANDADIQGLGSVAGKGVELMLTLGTGVGAGLYLDGKLVPNLELGHHPWRGGLSYEQRLGRKALKKIGKKKWRKRVRSAAETLDPIFNYRALYLGGGHSKFLRPKDLPANVRIVDNTAGLLGGIKLWT